MARTSIADAQQTVGFNYKEELKGSRFNQFSGVILEGGCINRPVFSVSNTNGNYITISAGLRLAVSSKGDNGIAVAVRLDENVVFDLDKSAGGVIEGSEAVVGANQYIRATFTWDDSLDNSVVFYLSDRSKDANSICLGRVEYSTDRTEILGVSLTHTDFSNISKFAKGFDWSLCKVNADISDLTSTDELALEFELGNSEKVNNGVVENKVGSIIDVSQVIANCQNYFYSSKYVSNRVGTIDNSSTQMRENYLRYIERQPIRGDDNVVRLADKKIPSADTGVHGIPIEYLISVAWMNMDWRHNRWIDDVAVWYQKVLDGVFKEKLGGASKDARLDYVSTDTAYGDNNSIVTTCLVNKVGDAHAGQVDSDIGTPIQIPIWFNHETGELFSIDALYDVNDEVNLLFNVAIYGTCCKVFGGGFPFPEMLAGMGDNIEYLGYIFLRSLSANSNECSAVFVKHKFDVVYGRHPDGDTGKIWHSILGSREGLVKGYADVKMDLANARRGARISYSQGYGDAYDEVAVFNGSLEINGRVVQLFNLVIELEWGGSLFPQHDPNTADDVKTLLGALMYYPMNRFGKIDTVHTFLSYQGGREISIRKTSNVQILFNGLLDDGERYDVYGISSVTQCALAIVHEEAKTVVSPSFGTVEEGSVDALDVGVSAVEIKYTGYEKISDTDVLEVDKYPILSGLEVGVVDVYRMSADRGVAEMFCAKLGVLKVGSAGADGFVVDDLVGAVSVPILPYVLIYDAGAGYKLYAVSEVADESEAVKGSDWNYVSTGIVSGTAAGVGYLGDAGGTKFVRLVSGERKFTDTLVVGRLDMIGNVPYGGGISETNVVLKRLVGYDTVAKIMCHPIFKGVVGNWQADGVYKKSIRVGDVFRGILGVQSDVEDTNEGGNTTHNYLIRVEYSPREFASGGGIRASAYLSGSGDYRGMMVIEGYQFQKKSSEQSDSGGVGSRIIVAPVPRQTGVSASTDYSYVGKALLESLGATYIEDTTSTDNSNAVSRYKRTRGIMGAIYKVAFYGNVQRVEASTFNFAGIRVLELDEGMLEVGDLAFAHNSIEILRIPKTLEDWLVNNTTSAFVGNIGLKYISVYDLSRYEKVLSSGNQGYNIGGLEIEKGSTGVVLHSRKQG